MQAMKNWRVIGHLPLVAKGGFLGLDPSFSGFGVCHIDEGGDVWVGQVAFKPHPERIRRIYEFVAALASLPYRAICVEGMVASGMAGKSSAIDSGVLGALCRLAILDKAWDSDCQVYEAQPTTMKKVVTGSGASAKNQTMLALFKAFKLDFGTGTDNEADACGHAIIAAIRSNALDVSKERVLSADKAADLRAA